MPNHLANTKRLVLVTGGASGIGIAAVRRFAQAGWNIFCHFHSNKQGARAVESCCREANVACELIEADLSTDDGISCVLDAVRMKNIDCLVNNAGAYIVQKHFSELNLADFTKSFVVNLAAPFLIASALFPDMCKRRFGRIVNISSIAAKYGGSPASMHYGCLKRGMEGITKTLSRIGAEHGVLVNTVRPGVIETQFHEKYPKDMSARIKLIPAKRMGDSDEVAELIHYLGSEVNTYITGQEIAISGGE